MTLRAKLLAAQAPLAVALLVFAVAATTTLSRLGSSPALILKDNYRSVLAAERMMESLEQLQASALATATGRPADHGAASEARARFEAELAVQEHNVTEKGEEDATRRLRESWRSYHQRLDELAAAPARDRLARWFDALVPAARGVRAAANDVLALNQDAMARKSDAASRAAERNVTAVAAATVAALVVVLASTFALTARLLRPLRELSGTVRRFGEGDHQARARVNGNDEIAAVAAEFNTMAEKLAEYRRSSLGELLQAQQASQAAIDSLPDPVLVQDAAGTILILNGAAESLLRLPGGGGAPSLATLEPELRAVVDRVRQHVLSGRGPYAPRGFEEAVRVASPDGSRYLLPRAAPLYSGEGGVAGVTIVLQDVTRLMRFEELKSDLVATVADEFRTPLASLRMAVHLAAEEAVGPLNEKQSELMQAARDDCERLQTIVDDLLDLSRVQSGRIALRIASVDAGTLMGDAAATLRSAAEAAGLDLRVSPPDPPVTVRADPERAKVVLSNLLANAVRHTPRGGEIEVRARAAGEDVRFEVRDTGEGIPREHLDRVFEKFFRVPGARSGGVGLGLYVSREIVRAHGGEMGVESELGRGSTFWFTLRLEPQQVAVAKATA
jgi:signal transduction histidine kinase